MRNKAKLCWRRREWDAVPADPTTAVSWTFGRKYHAWFEIELIGIWGVESKIRFGRYVVRGHDAFWAVQVFQWLEDGHNVEMMSQEEEPRIYM